MTQLPNITNPIDEITDQRNMSNRRKMGLTVHVTLNTGTSKL